MNRKIIAALATLFAIVLAGCSGEETPSQSKEESAKAGSDNSNSNAESKPTVEKGADVSSQRDLGKVVVSKETTYLTGPLKEDGTVDFMAALNQSSSEAVTPENNAAVLYWQAFGPGPIEEEFREPFFKLLGIETPPMDGEYFISLGDYLRRENSDLEIDEAYDLLGELRTRPWSAEEHPEFAAWLKANERPFKLLTEGAKRPRYYAPLAGPTLVKATSLLASSGVREVIRGLPARAMMQIEEEGAEATWEDLATCLRITRHYAQNGNSLVELLVAVAVAGVAHESCLAMASYADLPFDLQQRIDRELLDHGAFEVSDAVSVFERCALLEMLTQLLLHQKAKPVGDFAFLPELAKLRDPNRPLDVNETLRIANGYFDRLAQIQVLKDYAARLSAQAELKEDSRKRFAGDNPVDLFGDSAGAIELVMSGKTPKERGARAGAMLFHLVGSAWDAVLTACQRGNDKWQLTSLTFAAAAYRTENGNYPDTLAQLAPKNVSTVGRSSFTGEDFYYQRVDPSFILASAGPSQTQNVPKYTAQIAVAFDYRIFNEAKQKLNDAGWKLQYASIESDAAEVTDEQLRLIANIPIVERVGIGAADVTNDGLRSLAVLPRLVDLSLYVPQKITVEGLKHLEPLQRLEHLFLGAANISDFEMRPISNLAGLRYLNLSSSSISDKGLIQLVSLKKLTSLNISETKVTDDGLAALAQFPKLESLYLDRTKITDLGLQHLTKAKNMTLLSIQETKVSPEAIQQLQQALPKCNVTH